eukprot:9502964-Pyramimonas_sp.AAC.1
MRRSRDFTALQGSQRTCSFLLSKSSALRTFLQMDSGFSSLQEEQITCPGWHGMAFGTMCTSLRGRNKVARLSPPRRTALEEQFSLEPYNGRGE